MIILFAIIKEALIKSSVGIVLPDFLGKSAEKVAVIPTYFKAIQHKYSAKDAGGSGRRTDGGYLCGAALKL